MKWGGLILCLVLSYAAFCNPGDSVSRIDRKAERKTERQKARIERQRHRIMHKWDERTMQQKKTDRRVLIFMAISAGILVNSIAHKE